jgi:flagellar protein FliS
MNAFKAMRQYQNVNHQAKALEASPHQLIQMLFDGGLTRIAQARGAIERGWVAEKGELIGKAIGIVGGLRAALDLEKGGDIAQNLNSLYEYMTTKLSEANQKDDVACLDEVATLLREIKTGWDAIAP